MKRTIMCMYCSNSQQNEKIILHRHMIHNNTFVVQGEHRLYDPMACSRKSVPPGCTSPPSGRCPSRRRWPHQDVIVFFDMRGRDGVFYEILDDDQNVIASLGYGEFLGAYRAQEGIA